MAQPDMKAVETLCQLALVARRLGCTVRVIDPSRELRELIVLAGLADVLLGERPGRDEFHHPGSSIHPCPDTNQEP